MIQPNICFRCWKIDNKKIFDQDYQLNELTYNDYQESDSDSLCSKTNLYLDPFSVKERDNITVTLFKITKTTFTTTLA